MTPFHRLSSIFAMSRSFRNEQEACLSLQVWQGLSQSA